MLQQWAQKDFQFTLPMRYLHRGQGPGAIILLHGYQDHALSLTKRLGWLERDLPVQILAINAPFPVPVWKQDGFVEAYSWYFRDTSRDLMIVHPSTTAKKVSELAIEILGKNLPVVLFGFSQGGYLAPYVAAHLKQTVGIVTAGSGFPNEAYQKLSPPLPVLALHGELDTRWPIESSRQAHVELLSRGFSGEFKIIPSLDHRVDPILAPDILRFAQNCFKGVAA